VPTDRYLFRAGTAGYTYPQVLEIRKDGLRLLLPSAEARRRQRALSSLIALGYVFVAGSALTGLAGPLSRLSPVLIVAEVVVFLGGFVAVTVWWDRRSLPLLAESPAESAAIEVVSTESFGTFQEIRARANGAELRVAVPASRETLGKAMRFATGFTSR
jgi:hypothetical protein